MRKWRTIFIVLLAFAIGTSVDLLTKRGLSENLKDLLIAGAGIYLVGSNSLKKLIFALAKRKDNGEGAG